MDTRNESIAQSFSHNEKDGIFLTKIELYFHTIDQIDPIYLEIREMINGYPSSTVVPSSTVIRDVDDILASTTKLIPTEFVFEEPIFIPEGIEFCIVVGSTTDVSNSKVWTSEMGSADLEGKVIIKQPLTGSFFRSENNSSWVTEQLKDLCFTLYKAVFDTSKIGLVELVNSEIQPRKLVTDPVKVKNGLNQVRVYADAHGLLSKDLVNFVDPIFLTINGVYEESLAPGGIQVGYEDFNFINSFIINLPFNVDGMTSPYVGGSNVVATTNIPFDIFYFNGSDFVLPQTHIEYGFKYILNTRKFSENISINIKRNVELTKTGYILSKVNENIHLNGGKSLVITAKLYSNNPNVSPVIDLSSMSVDTIKNLIHSNDPTKYIAEVFETVVVPPSTVVSLVWNSLTSDMGVDTLGRLWVLGNLNCSSVGSNQYGHFGLGMTGPVSTLTQVGIDTNWETLDTDAHSVAAAVKTDSTLWTWGRNNYGQLGLGNTTDVSTPTSNPFLNGMGDITVSHEGWSMYGTRVDGSLWSWGFNYTGQLGDGTTTNRSSPVSITGPTWYWLNVDTSGYSTAGVDLNHDLWMWGDNGYGVLGDGTTTNRSVPTKISTNAANWLKAKVNGSTTVAMGLDGKLWSWGGNYFGQLGDGTTTSRSSPVSLSGIWNEFSVGNLHVAAIKNDATLWSWGAGEEGQLGDGTNTISQLSMVQIAGGGTWGSVACGEFCSAAIKSDGTLWTWGNNYYMQLGIGDSNPASSRNSPVQIAGGGTGWNSCAIGTKHGAATKSDGSLWVWGNNYEGQLGQNDTVSHSSPVSVAGTNWINVSVGSYNTLANKGDGSLWVWGDNVGGQLGQNDTVNRSSPVSLPSIYPSNIYWDQISLGKSGTRNIFATQRGHIMFIGDDNGTGLVSGTGSVTLTSSPISIGSINLAWLHVSAGITHVAATKIDGTLWTWGSNYDGELGDNTTVSKLSPTEIIPSTYDWSFVSAGIGHVAAVKFDGSLWTWGNNMAGQLGDGTTTNRSSPVSIVSGNNWVDISAGALSTGAITSTGELWAAGYTAPGGYEFLGMNTTLANSSLTSFTRVGTNNNWAFITPYTNMSGNFPNIAEGVINPDGIAFGDRYKA